MEIKTKFNIGDEVFTIDTYSLRMKSFKVARICSWTTSDGTGTNVSVYDSDSYPSNSYDENKCFSSEEELFAHIKAQGDAAAL